MLESIVSTIVNLSAVVLVLHNISSRKVDFKNKKMYISFLLMCTFAALNFIYLNSVMRLVISTIITFLGNYIIFNDQIRKNLVSTLMCQLIIVVSELLYAIFLFVLINPIVGDSTILNFSGEYVTNFIISVIMVLLSLLPFIKIIYVKLLNLFSKVKVSSLLIFVSLLIFPINILVFMVYSGTSLFKMLIINILFLIVYAIIIYFAINEKSQNIKFKEENEILLTNLNEYEKMLDYQRVNNHENKNQLLVIRGMISKNNTKALDYLDEIITEKRKDDEGLYTYAKIIPEGGLQGLVYQKMLKMKENGINISFNVDKNIRKIKFDSISAKTNYDLCRAVGIILDNAIEEVNKLEEKEILISMYKEDLEFVIEVSNECDIVPDLSKLDEKGYTTKSNGHGYGLSLLKEIIVNNKNIKNERSLTKNIFTQIIKIKM